MNTNKKLFFKIVMAFVLLLAVLSPFVVFFSCHFLVLSVVLFFLTTTSLLIRYSETKPPFKFGFALFFFVVSLIDISLFVAGSPPLPAPIIQGLGGLIFIIGVPFLKEDGSNLLGWIFLCIFIWVMLTKEGASLEYLGNVLSRLPNGWFFFLGSLPFSYSLYWWTRSYFKKDESQEEEKKMEDGDKKK